MDIDPTDFEGRILAGREILDDILTGPWAALKAVEASAKALLAETETPDDRAKAQMRARWPEHYRR
jgi:hypothetical protein